MSVAGLGVVLGIDHFWLGSAVLIRSRGSPARCLCALVRDGSTLDHPGLTFGSAVSDVASVVAPRVVVTVVGRVIRTATVDAAITAAVSVAVAIPVTVPPVIVRVAPPVVDRPVP